MQAVNQVIRKISLYFARISQPNFAGVSQSKFTGISRTVCLAGISNLTGISQFNFARISQPSFAGVSLSNFTGIYIC